MVRAVCCVPVSPLRAEPAHKSEMVSQQLFGESCLVLEEAKDWTRVRCSYDGYEGWCTRSHLVGVGRQEIGRQETDGWEIAGDKIDGPKTEPGGTVYALTPEWVNELEYNGQPMRVPLGSTLTGLKKGRAAWGTHWGGNKIDYKGTRWDTDKAPRDAESIRRLAYTFLNTPYLWGGKSVFGVDCSGFTQTVMKFFGVPLLRDAYQQATQGESVGFLEEARLGDLAFFDNAEGRITHVGILLNGREIIHASGKVRVDGIDNMGIVHAESFERTHHLRVIRRAIR